MTFYSYLFTAYISNFWKAKWQRQKVEDSCGKLTSKHTPTHTHTHIHTHTQTSPNDDAKKRSTYKVWWSEWTSWQGGLLQGLWIGLWKCGRQMLQLPSCSWTHHKYWSNLASLWSHDTQNPAPYNVASPLSNTIVFWYSIIEFSIELNNCCQIFHNTATETSQQKASASCSLSHNTCRLLFWGRPGGLSKLRR